MTRFRVVVVSILGLTLDLLPLCQRNPENTRSTSLAGYFQPTLRLTDPQAGDFGGENVVTPKVSLEMLLSRLVPELLAAKREKCRTPTQGTETISAQRGDLFAWLCCFSWLALIIGALGYHSPLNSTSEMDTQRAGEAVCKTLSG